MTMRQIRPELEEIKKDLEVFADPGREVLIDSEAAIWEQDGEERRILFSWDYDGASGPTVEYHGVSMPFRAFLASRDMADLRQLAEFMVRTMPTVEPFVQTLAMVEDDPGSRDTALELISRRATRNLPYLATRLLFVRGEAGAGKTIVLREMTRRQAERVEQGQDQPLFLYVDAQGRALARLEEAMAKELGSLKAKFNDSAVAVLARRNLLVPIIDGFDELLGSGGYADAFSSLSSFVARLDGRGAVIASARSTFYYGVLRESAERFSSGRYKAETIVVNSWTDRQVVQFISASAGISDDEVSTIVEDLSESDLDLLGKPFYAAKFSELVVDGFSPDSESSLLEQLVGAFLKREVGKVLDKEGRPLLDYSGHLEFITTLADEMWWLENQGLDIDTIKVHAELLAEDRGLSPNDARNLIAKVESYAFLTAEKGRYTFEHQVFYGFFLARRLARYVEQGGADLRRFLSRSVMEPSLVNQCANFISELGVSGAEAIANVCGVLRPTVSDLIARENGGLLVAGFFRDLEDQIERVEISNLVMRDEDFGGVVLRNVEFADCEFNRIDLSRASLLSCDLLNSHLVEVKVARGSTRLDGTEFEIGRTVFGLFVLGEGRIDSPSEMAAVLQSLGAVVPNFEDEGYSEEVEDRIEEIHRVAYIFERQYWVSLEEDDDGRALRRLDHWGAIERLLRKWNLLEERTLTKSGPPVAMLRLAVPPEVLRKGAVDSAGVPANVRKFWTDITREGGN